MSSAYVLSSYVGINLKIDRYGLMTLYSHEWERFLSFPALTAHKQQRIWDQIQSLIPNFFPLLSPSCLLSEIESFWPRLLLEPSSENSGPLL